MDTNAIINAAMQQLVSTVADEVIRRLKAETAATATLEPEQLQFAVLRLLESDTLIREEVRIIVDDRFNEVEARLDTIENDDRENTSIISADDSDFDSAVMQVLRNNI
jgi:polyhydroxyalkanoate synthesis regulator phasin